MKKIYICPETEVIEAEAGGVVCASNKAWSSGTLTVLIMVNIPMVAKTCQALVATLARTVPPQQPRSSTSGAIGKG